MWKAVFGEDAEAPMNFFYVMDMDGNGCVDESESLQMLELMGQKCT